MGNNRGMVGGGGGLPEKSKVPTQSSSHLTVGRRNLVDFVLTGFDETHVLVSLPLAVVIIVVDVIGIHLVLGIYVMNAVYRNCKAIKASSSRLNHFAYIGCYLILLATLLHTMTETFPVSMQSKSILCNAFPWSLIIGLSLVFEEVTAKTWMLILHLKSSQKFRSGYNAVMSDTVWLFYYEFG